MAKPKSRREKRKEKALMSKNQPLFFQGIDISTDEKMNHFNRTCIGIIGCGGVVKDVLKIDDETLEYIYSLSYAFYQEARYDKCLPLFHLLTLLDHSNPKFIFGLAAVHQMKGSWASAMELYAASFVMDKTDPTALLRVSECGLKIGEDENATKALEKAIIIAGNQKKYSELKERAILILKELKS